MVELRDKKILVWGMGLSGQSAAKRLQDHGCKKLDYYDEVLTKYTLSSSELAQKLKVTDLIILSPGVDPSHPQLQAFPSAQVWGEIELACQFFPPEALVIGVTGSNGKSTTVSFFQHLLEKTGQKVFLGGNIGVPASSLDLAQKWDVILLELSSFQLETLHTFHCDLACCLNLSFTHGERYSSLQDYARAKSHIFDRMGSQDFALVPESGRSWVEGRSVPFEVPITQQVQAFIQKFDWSCSSLLSQVHGENLYCVYRLYAQMENSEQKRDLIFQQALESFVSLPHRLEFIGEYRGLKVYNDSKSTNWASTLKALDCFENPVYLILGGQRRGQNDSILPWIQQLQPQVKKLFLIGEMGPALAAEVGEALAWEQVESLEGFKDILPQLAAGVLLFSPAFPSFDAFTHYAHRGESFKTMIQKTLEQ